MGNEPSPVPSPPATRPAVHEPISSSVSPVSPVSSLSLARRWTVCALITVIAAVLRFHALAAKSFWVDEGISVGIARLRWSQFFQVLWRREANMALYYLLLHFWMKAGSGEAYVRSLSVIFSVATVPLLYVLGARLFGPATGLLAAWLLAINAFHIRYAQDARSYSLVVFLAVLSTWLFVRNLDQTPEKTTTPHWRAYALVSAMAVYSHFYALLLVPAHAISLLWLPREHAHWRDFGRSLRWFAYLMLPIALFIISTGTAPVNWIGSPGVASVSQLVEWFAGNRGAILVALEALVLLLALLAGQTTKRQAPSLARWKSVLVFAWLLLPIATILAVSLLKPVFLPRYLIFCLPALLLAVAAGCMRLRPAVLKWLLCAVISVLCLQGASSYYHRDFDIYRDDWRDATAYVLDNAQPGDAIFFLTLGRMPYEYYKSLKHPAVAGPVVLNAPGDAELEVQDFIPVSLGEALRDARPAPDRVWVVLLYGLPMTSTPDQATQVLRAWYGHDRQLLRQKEFPQIRIFLFGRNAENSGGASSSP